MSDWSSDLDEALADGNPAYMHAMLARVPSDVLQQAAPYVEVLARNSEEVGDWHKALTYYGKLIELAPDNVDWHEGRARANFNLDRFAAALTDARQIAQLEPGLALGHRLCAEAHVGLRELPQAVAAYRQALRCAPNDDVIRERIEALETELHNEAMVRQAADPEAAQQAPQVEVRPPPQVTFDPALFEQPGIPESFEKPMVEGLKQLLWRYSGQQSSKNTLVRIEDPVWLSAWDKALGTTTGSNVLFRGSELGTFALQALNHGASRALAVEPFPLDGRIASGVIHKNLLTRWHALHGAEIQTWSEEQRRQSFDSFAHCVDVVPPDSEQLDNANCDFLVFPNIDHSLLGTGIVKAIRQHRLRGLAAHAHILPARAKIYAMGIEWAYPSTSFNLQPMNQFRWNFHPQPLDLSAACWTAVTESACIGEIDFENFAESTWEVQLPVVANGNVDAVVFWFDLQLGASQLSNAPGSDLECIKPAVQYVDSIGVAPGESLPLKIRLLETRLHFQADPPVSRIRSNSLPSWYMPMLLDKPRNDAYGTALDRALSTAPGQTVLDIGAGCGLLSMMAARAGAARVVGCEMSLPIAKVGNEVIKRNGFDDRVTLINKDCRSLKLPDDLAERADLAVFELFDCSLIGEGVLHFLAHAREHLLKSGARYLPKSARIRAMLIEYRLDRVWDCDVNLLNPYRFSPAFINVDAGRLNYRPLTEPVDIFSFDFATATPAAQEKELEIAATAEGTAGAMLFWFDLQLDEELWISNAPDAGTQFHWKQGLQFLPEAQVTREMQLPLLAKHDGSGLSFRWRQDAVPKESISKLPRFDPRALAATSELQQQTRGLLQHCAQHTDEYLKVAELAKRFAIDPASHDLDPTIAQRFAATFFGP